MLRCDHRTLHTNSNAICNTRNIEMPTEPALPKSEIIQRVQERIESRQLPLARPTTIYGGYGSGRNVCSACGEEIASGKVEYEIEDPQSRGWLFFHFDCYVIWQRECTHRLR
jgi:hypothetical protein